MIYDWFCLTDLPLYDSETFFGIPLSVVVAMANIQLFKDVTQSQSQYSLF